MSVHGERPSDLVRERTLADREAERVLYGRETRSGHVSPACGRIFARDFTAHHPQASVNGPRVPAPQGARATPTSSGDERGGER